MSPQTPAGWYPDTERSGGMRYWDGSQWTPHRSAPGGQETPPAAATPAPAIPAQGPREPQTPLWRKGWVLGVAGGLVGLIIGAAAAGGGDVTSDPGYVKLAQSNDSTKSKLDSVQADLKDAKSALGDLPSREAALKSDRAKLAKDQARLKSALSSVEQAKAAVLKREKKVGIVEKDIAANTVSGEGMYKVGSEMKPGTYKSAGASGCYYAILNSTDTSDIADNNNVDGPAFVTLNGGQYFQTTRCADWILQR